MRFLAYNLQLRVSYEVMRQRSLQIEIIIPILLIIILNLGLTIFITERITAGFAREYAQKRLQGEIIELELLMAFPQKAHLFEREFPESIPFAIVSDRTRIVFNIDSMLMEKIQGLKFQEGKVTELKHNNLKYYALKKETEKATIYAMINEKDIPGFQSLSLIKEALIGGGLLLLILTSIILRTNLLRPIKSLIKDLKTGARLRTTGIRELDHLGSTINRAIEEIENRSEKYIILHKIAVELNTISELKSVLNNILEYSREILDAQYGALAIYDTYGRFSDLIVTGVETRPSILPEGKGILKLMQLSLTPVRISDIKKHPAFSGHLPEDHPEIVSFIGYPVFSVEGRPLGALYFANKRSGEFTEEDEAILRAITADIAIGLQREQVLDEMRRFKRIIESAFDMIVITDRDGNIVYVNKAFEIITGYSRNEALGKNPNILKSGFHNQEFYRNLWQTILSGHPWKGEFINRKKSGEIYIAAASIFPLLDNAGNITHFVSIQRDISEEKKLYEQLLRAQKMEAIGTLAGGIAHDFNNILTSILGYAELLKDSLSENKELLRYADIIEKSANRGADLAKKILTVTRKEHAEFRSVNINAIILETVEILRKSIPPEIEIELKLKEDLPNIRADYSQMSQVLMNLAINARDAMPEGGKLLIATDLVGSENGAANGIGPQRGMNFIKLTVEDTGSGIPLELQSKVFDPFFTTKEPDKGTGLGLYIVHSIITNHGGYINLYSEPGRGTRFNIYLPVFTEELKEAEIEESQEETVTGNVLIIDDEPYVCELYEDILGKAGFRVFTSTDPREGIRLFKEKDIDVVILDLVMPKLSGREVFQILRELKKEPKIILSSGYSAEIYSDISRMLEGGAKAFIQKPVSPKTLLMTIRRVLKA